MHESAAQDTWTSRLAQASARHPRRVIAAWGVAVLVGAAAIAMLLGTALTSNDDFTGQPESKRAGALIDEAFPPRPGGFDADEAVILRSASRDVRDPAFQDRIDALVRELSALRTVEAVQHARADGGDALVSRDGRATAILLDLRHDVEPVADLVARSSGGGFEALLIGDGSIDADFERAAEEDLQRGELIGLGLALVVLLAVFGTLAASLVPIVMAVVAIIVALGAVAAIGQVFALSFFVVNLLVMMGLAVGIDYSLFVLSRFREERRAGRDTAEAIAVAGATASNAVVFSGMTVVLALIGMFLVPQTLFRSLATGAIVVVVVSVLAALTLLPAALAVLGDRVEALPVRLRRRPHGHRPSLSDRLAGGVLRRPRASLAAGMAIMLTLAVPYLGMETGSAGVATLPDEFQTKQAYAALAESFPDQGTADAEIVVSGPVTSPRVAAGVRRLATAIERDGAFGPVRWKVAADGRHGLLTARVAGDALEPRAVAAVRRLRETHIPQALAGVPAQALVAGETAGEVDFFDIADRYQVLVVAVVLGLSFLVLTAAFRSVVAPALAIVMNLLSVGAAYGLLVLVFQEGVGAELLGFQPADTVEAWLPLFLFTVLFGLSMDYQVFLMSRIRERYDESGDTEDAIRTGLGATARLITGAALIMVAVFAGFAGGQLVMFQQMGFGLGVAVLLDATLVRCVLVPAAMQLLGHRNWYLPAGVRGRRAARALA